MTFPLFVFGTLMDADLRDLVIGRALAPDCIGSAMVRGFRRLYVRGRDYPMLSPHPGGSVDGLLLRGLDAAEMVRLDGYEGPEYRRCPVEVLASGRRVAVKAYLCRPGVAHDGRDWTLDRWLARHKRTILRRMVLTSPLPHRTIAE